MNYFEEEVINDIKEKSDIVEIIGEDLPLKKKGRNYISLCPFHSEKTPSFFVSPEKQIYHCFGCKESGNVITFLLNYKKYSFIEAMKYLIDKFNIDIDITLSDNKNKNIKKIEYNKEKLYSIHTFVSNYFCNKLYDSWGKNAYNYILKRGINKEVLNEFKIGYVPYYCYDLIEKLLKLGYNKKDLIDSGIFGENSDYKIYCKFYNRIIFPIKNIYNKIIGFGGRNIDNENPKYINSSETLIFKKKYNLYGIDKSILEIRRKNQVIVVEGYMDVISLWQYGIKNVVAVLGTAFTEEHAKFLSRYSNEIILAFDNDEAGKKAIEKSIGILKRFDIFVKIVCFEEGLDPDEFIIKHGLNLFLKKIRNSISIFEYKLNENKKKYNYKKPEDRAKLIKNMLPIIMNSKDNILKKEYIVTLSREINISVEDLEYIIFGFNKVRNKIFKYKNNTNKLKKKEKNIGEYEKTQWKVLGFFLNNMNYTDLINNKILNYFSIKNIKKIIKYIISIPKEKRKISLLIDLITDKEIKKILIHFSFKDEFIEINKDDFLIYLNSVKKFFIKKEIKKIIEKMKKDNNIKNIENLKNKWIFYNNELKKIKIKS